MANVDNPHGFKVLSHLHGAPTNFKTNLYRKEASVILGLGDAVVLAGSASTAGTNGADKTGIPTVTRAAGASGTISGVAVGFIHDADGTSPAYKKHYMAAADKGYVLVCDDKDAMFSIQEDSDTVSLAVTDVGEGVDLITAANANSVTGYSVFEIDSSTSPTGGGSADQLRVHSLLQAPDNELGANARWVVSINEHTYKGVGTMI